MPEGRASGRSAATSIDGAEHGAMLPGVMVVPQEHTSPYTTRREPIANCRRFCNLA